MYEIHEVHKYNEEKKMIAFQLLQYAIAIIYIIVCMLFARTLSLYIVLLFIGLYICPILYSFFTRSRSTNILKGSKYYTLFCCFSFSQLLVIRITSLPHILLLLIILLPISFVVSTYTVFLAEKNRIKSDLHKKIFGIVSISSVFEIALELFSYYFVAYNFQFYDHFYSDIMTSFYMLIALIVLKMISVFLYLLINNMNRKMA